MNVLKIFILVFLVYFQNTTFRVFLVNSHLTHKYQNSIL